MLTFQPQRPNPPVRWEIAPYNLPAEPDNLLVTDDNGLVEYFATSLTGLWQLFYSSAYLEITGKGYIQARWEVEHRVCGNAPMGEDPTVKIYWGDNDGVTTPANWDSVNNDQVYLDNIVISAQ